MEIFPDWFPLDYLPHWALAFGATLGLTTLRRRLAAKTYAIIWCLLLVACAIFGGGPVIEYATRHHTWHRAIPFLPGLVLFCTAAKFQPLWRRKVYVATLILLTLCLVGFLVIIEPFDVWTRLLGPEPPKSGGPFLGAGGEVVTELHWYFIGATWISLLVAVLLVWPKLFTDDGLYPCQPPRLAVTKRTNLDDASRLTGFDLQIPQRPLLRVGGVDLLFAAASAVAMAISYSAASPQTFSYAAGYLGGLLGTKLGIAMSYRRLEFSLAAAIVGAFFMAVMAGDCLGYMHQQWSGPIGHVGLDVARIAESARSICWTVGPKSVAVGLLSTALYLLWWAASSSRQSTTK